MGFSSSSFFLFVDSFTTSLYELLVLFSFSHFPAASIFTLFNCSLLWKVFSVVVEKCKFIYSAECDLENQFNNQLIFKIMLTLNEIENLEKK